MSAFHQMFDVDHGCYKICGASCDGGQTDLQPHEHTFTHTNTSAHIMFCWVTKINKHAKLTQMTRGNTGPQFLNHWARNLAKNLKFSGFNCGGAILSTNLDC